MSYSKDRERFIAIMTAAGLDLDRTRALLRYATTLQRLAEAQCNGDWPYNGERDRPSAISRPCGACNGEGMRSPIGAHKAVTCGTCGGTGNIWARDVKAHALHDRQFATCPHCGSSGVAKTAMRMSPNQKARVCPDCRTNELAAQSLPAGFRAHFQGDPRGYVFYVAVPSGKRDYSDALGIGVPARY